MRIFMIFIRGAERAAVEAHLDAHYLGRHDLWLWTNKDGTQIDISIGSPPDSGMEKRIYRLHHSSLCLHVYIFGPRDTVEEATAITMDLLSHFDGCAVDDHITRAWTLEEIQEKRIVDCHRFLEGQVEYPGISRGHYFVGSGPKN